MEQVEATASRDGQPLGKELARLVEAGLGAERRIEAALDAARAAYRARLAAEGREPMTVDELWSQMQTVREEVARELYPD